MPLVGGSWEGQDLLEKLYFSGLRTPLGPPRTNWKVSKGSGCLSFSPIPVAPTTQPWLSSIKFYFIFLFINLFSRLFNNPNSIKHSATEEAMYYVWRRKCDFSGKNCWFLKASTHHSINVSRADILFQSPVVIRRHGHHVVLHSGWVSGPESHQSQSMIVQTLPWLFDCWKLTLLKQIWVLSSCSRSSQCSPHPLVLELKVIKTLFSTVQDFFLLTEWS